MEKLDFMYKKTIKKIGYKGWIYQLPQIFLSIKMLITCIGIK